MFKFSSKYDMHTKIAINKLKEFNNLYTYKTDRDKFKRKESWEVITPSSSDGRYYGDCESYLLTLIELKIIPKETELYYCRLDGIGHCIGILNDLVIDCGTKKFISLDKYIDTYKITDLRKYYSVEIWWYKTTTKFLGYVPFIN